MKELSEIIKIGDIHLYRINSAIKHIGHLFPLDKDKLSTLDENDLVWIELLVSRFGKLQDLIGSKIIDLYLEMNQENTLNLTMLDKIHKLEKLGIIKNSELWRDMRNARNHVAHEYPDNPAVMAGNLNQIFTLTPELISIFERIKNLSVKY